MSEESVFSKLPSGMCLHDDPLLICQECADNEIADLKADLAEAKELLAVREHEIKELEFLRQELLGERKIAWTHGDYAIKYAKLESKLLASEAREAAMRKALEPFASKFSPDVLNVSDNPEFQTFLDNNLVTPQVRMGDFRRAWEALQSPAEPTDVMKVIELAEKALAAIEPKLPQIQMYGSSKALAELVDEAIVKLRALRGK